MEKRLLHMILEAIKMKTETFFKQLLTPKQVAKRLGLKSEWTIYRYIKAGKLKVIKLTERNFRIAEKDLNQFIKKHKTK